jgi:hypothetical protein
MTHVMCMRNFSFGDTTRNHLIKIAGKLDPILKQNFIYLYISLFDCTRWVMCSSPTHTLMKNNEHPQTNI